MNSPQLVVTEMMMIMTVNQSPLFLFFITTLLPTEPLASKKRKRTLSATAKRKGPKQKRAEHSGSEAGEDTDEGEMESREMDYYSDTSSDSEEEKVTGDKQCLPSLCAIIAVYLPLSILQVKQAVKDEPRDDAEVERKEEEPIDHVFEESSSDDENEDLTESGMITIATTIANVATFLYF